MLKKKEIESLIIDAEKEYGFKQGYKLFTKKTKSL